MKIFYCGRTINRHLLLAGAIHLGRLPDERLPTVAELNPIHKSACWGRDHWGIPFFLGADREGNEVYALLLGSDFDMGLQAIYHLLNQTSDPTQWKFVKTPQRTNRWLGCGFFCAGRLHWEEAETFSIKYGLAKGYFELVNLVRQVKEGTLLGNTESGRNY